jgi:thiamine pyrophosphate-dependent acetolactate synthase large subunit-like protein
MLYKTSYGTVFRKKDSGEPYNPDFAKMAESYGAKGETVKKPQEIGKALKKALDSQSPYVLDVIVDKDSYSLAQSPGSDIYTVKRY